MKRIAAIVLAASAVLSGCNTEHDVPDDRIIIKVEGKSDFELSEGTADWKQGVNGNELFIRVWGGDICIEAPVFPENDTMRITVIVPESLATNGEHPIGVNRPEDVGVVIAFYGENDDGTPDVENYVVSEGMVNFSFHDNKIDFVIDAGSSRWSARGSASATICGDD